ncbi:hypothetical protein DVH24_022893 [Malus domestica]|uniref:Uncharacterized protein n=1 Tax=Malus domestica TaxID=3750 RepID=A0A498KKQ7_MALDO|nr:hypothetical protein DVH24_022893 [Malus domestica]
MKDVACSYRLGGEEQLACDGVALNFQARASPRREEGGMNDVACSYRLGVEELACDGVTLSFQARVSPRGDEGEGRKQSAVGPTFLDHFRATCFFSFRSGPT